MTIHIRLASLLMDIEASLRSLEQWQEEHPPAEALASNEPFCVDTLQFHQWLQFVFVPRMYFLVESEGPLPPRCDIAPMAEEYYRSADLAVGELIETLRRIDQLLNEQ